MKTLKIVLHVKDKMVTKDNVFDINNALKVKEFISEANETILMLENALYLVLEQTDLKDAKQVAADALGEDLNTYLEADDLSELDFEDDTNLPWEEIDSVYEPES